MENGAEESVEYFVDFMRGCKTQRSLELHFIQVFIQEHVYPSNNTALMGSEFSFHQLVGCPYEYHVTRDCLDIKHTLYLSRRFFPLGKGT